MSVSNAQQLSVIRLTSPGRSAVASLLLEGPGAAKLLDGLFERKSTRSGIIPGNRLMVGRFVDKNQNTTDRGEDVVVRCRSEESVELHCHGGAAAVARIEQTLVGRGCKVADWRDWINARDETDSIRAEARRALAQAETPQTAAVLLDQYQGVLESKVQSIQTLISDANATAAVREIESLLGWADFGCHLIEPWKVVLAGRPNVGKSTLINALVGYSRAIVHHAPGTTRDVLTAATALEGWPVMLTDTAGLRSTDHPIERAGVELAEEELQTADLVLLLFDASQPWSDEDRQLANRLPSALIVYNKIDLSNIDPESQRIANAPAKQSDACFTSAIEGKGIEELATAIGRRLVPERPPALAAVPFTSRQVHALETTQKHVAHGDLAAAVSALRALL